MDYLIGYYGYIVFLKKSIFIKDYPPLLQQKLTENNHKRYVKTNTVIPIKYNLTIKIKDILCQI